MVLDTGHSAFLSASEITADGGTLYGNSNINISGGQVNGNIYGAGRGTSNYGTNRATLAQMYGDAVIVIQGNPVISGSVFGAGEGIGDTGFGATARLTGNTILYIQNDIGLDVYGGGYAGEVIGNTKVYVTAGNITGTIYGGGNVGLVNGTTEVNIWGGSSANIYGGGKSANVTTTGVYLYSGTVTNIYGGSNESGIVNESYIGLSGGTVETVYGGNNVGGDTISTVIEVIRWNDYKYIWWRK